jgi:hypothetical protein
LNTSGKGYKKLLGLWLCSSFLSTFLSLFIYICQAI